MQMPMMFKETILHYQFYTCYIDYNISVQAQNLWKVVSVPDIQIMYVQTDYNILEIN